MNTTPITISVPNHIYDQVVRYVPQRQRSKIFSDMISTKIIEIKKSKSTNPWEDFFLMAQKLPKKPGAFKNWLEHRHDDLA